MHASSSQPAAGSEKEMRGNDLVAVRRRWRQKHTPGTADGVVGDGGGSLAARLLGVG